MPGKPDESLLLDMISGDTPEMPQKEKPLSKEEVAGIRSWIETGAHWPDGLTLNDRRFDGQRWWAFEPLGRPQVRRQCGRPGPARRSTRSSWPRSSNRGSSPAPRPIAAP